MAEDTLTPWMNIRRFDHNRRCRSYLIPVLSTFPVRLRLARGRRHVTADDLLLFGDSDLLAGRTCDPDEPNHLLRSKTAGKTRIYL